MRLLVVAVLFVAAGWIAARPGLALGAAFQRGDVFMSGAAGISEYSPTGQLEQTLADSSGGGVPCFDPSGQYLIAPGVGLWDSSGNRVASNWAGAPQGSCVVDRFGHVYLGTAGPDGVLLEYDLRGDLLDTRHPAVYPGLDAGVLSPDLAPDECTIYYSAGWGVTGDWIYRFNVCTNTQESPFVWPSAEAGATLHVLPNWQILVATYQHAALLDASGNVIRYYSFPDGSQALGSQCLDVSAPDPDGTSFWLGWDCSSGPPAIGRFDINSGGLLAEWAPSNDTRGPFVVYAGRTPPTPNPPPAQQPPNASPPTMPPVGAGIVNSGAPVVHTPSPAQIRALLSAILARLKTSDIKALLSAGGYSFSWNAPTAGHLFILWYQVSKRAHISRKARPILVASASRTFSHSGTVRLTLAFTSAGRRLLRFARHLNLTAIGSFTSVGQSATTIRRELTLGP
jgi:hypothetical protein